RKSCSRYASFGARDCARSPMRGSADCAGVSVSENAPLRRSRGATPASSASGSRAAMSARMSRISRSMSSGSSTDGNASECTGVSKLVDDFTAQPAKGEKTHQKQYRGDERRIDQRRPRGHAIVEEDRLHEAYDRPHRIPFEDAGKDAR